MSHKVPIDEVILTLENRLLQPEVRKSRAELTELLAEDFVEYGSSGLVHDRRSIIEALGEESSVTLNIKEFRTTRLKADIVLATYRAISSGDEGKPDQHSLRSSIWICNGGDWQMIFHQGTPTPAG